MQPLANPMDEQQQALAAGLGRPARDRARVGPAGCGAAGGWEAAHPVAGGGATRAERDREVERATLGESSAQTAGGVRPEPEPWAVSSRPWLWDNGAPDRWLPSSRRPARGVSGGAGGADLISRSDGEAHVIEGGPDPALSTK